MDKVFFIGIIIGILSRLIMLHLDQKQYPTEPNVLLSQLVLAFVASSLGSLFGELSSMTFTRLRC